MIRAASYWTRIVATLLAIVATSCARDLPTAPSVVDSSRRASVASAAPTPVFGPINYTRDTGPPRTDTASFDAVAGDTLTVHLSTTAPQGLIAWIRLNGMRIFETSDRRRLPDSLKVVARNANALAVWMGGKPGSNVRVTITAPRPTAPPPTHALTVISGASVAGATTAGTYTLTQGAQYQYAFKPAAGFHRLTVLLDGQPVADSGSIVMDQAHWLAASADTMVTLDAPEAELAQLFRAALNSATPRESWVAFQQRVRTLSDAWGAEAERHLARVYYASLDPVADASALVRLDSAVAGLVEDEQIPDNGVMLSVLSASAHSARRRVGLRSVTPATTPAREPMHLLVVNGILNSLEDARAAGAFVAYRIAREPLRFPRGTVSVSHYWNSTLSVARASDQAARICTFLVLAQQTTRGVTLPGGGPSVIADFVATLVTCIAQMGIRNVDAVETIRWVQQAQVGEAQREYDIIELAKLMKAYTDSSNHLFVIGHSEGSVLTQLAALRLKRDYGFNETSAPRCLGTISVAGAGTASWPLSDRHSRFVVAKHDVVTLLPGALRNARPTFEDGDTRAVDSTLTSLEQLAVASPSLATVVALHAARLFASVSIHSFLRYLSSNEDWALISANLDELYRTCAIGTVTVAPSAKTLQLYGSADFSATWQALDGQPLPTADSVVWTTDPSLATVSSSGRVTAGDITGIAPVVATVRQVVGSAAAIIVDDSLSASYLPPTIDAVVTRREFLSFGDGELAPAVYRWVMSVSATAMPGATIENVEVRRRLNSVPDSEFVAYSGPLPDGDFVYQALSGFSDGTMTQASIQRYAAEDFAWYRVIITDSHGKKAEFIGTSAEPHIGP